MLMSHLVEAYWSQILNMTLRYVMFLSMCRSLLSGAKPVTGWVIFNLNVGNYWCISQIIPLQKCLTERFFFFFYFFSKPIYPNQPKIFTWEMLEFFNQQEPFHTFPTIIFVQSFYRPLFKFFFFVFFDQTL